MNLILLILAIVAFVIAALVAFIGGFGLSILGIVAVGLAFFAAAHLPLPAYGNRQ